MSMWDIWQDIVMSHSAVDGRTPSDATVVLREESSKLTIRKQQHDSTSNRKEWVSSVSCFIRAWSIELSQDTAVTCRTVVLIVISKEKRPRGRLKHRWVDNNKIDLKWIGLEAVEWTYWIEVKAQCQTLVNMVVNHQVL